MTFDLTAREALEVIAEMNHQDTCESRYGAALSECSCHVLVAKNGLREVDAWGRKK